MNQIWLAFITGLTTGGISCFAVQGGFIASGLTDENGETLPGKSLKVASFLTAKLFAYTILGFGLGFLGSKLTFSPQFLGWMQILAGIFMLGTAGRLLDIHPVFRYFVIQPPKFAYRVLRNKSKVNSIFTPALLGLLTILIPCGVTQAMMTVAIASGNAITGASIMFAFILGTSPIFFVMGIAIVELFKRKSFIYLASLVVIFLGLLSINAGQVVRGSAHTAQNYWAAFASLFNNNSVSKGTMAQIVEGVQQVTINAYSNGYKSDTTNLKVNTPVKLTLIANNVTSCAKSFVIPSLKLFKTLPENGTESLEFTPTKTGLLTYTCGMGMYSGSFNVVE